jgi:hypothetical protein
MWIRRLVLLLPFFFLHINDFKIKLQICGNVLCFITEFEIKLKMSKVSTMVV